MLTDDAPPTSARLAPDLDNQQESTHTMDQQPKSELTVLRDYLTAVLSVRRARTVFLIIVVLSLLVHMGAYGAARWGHQLTQKVKQVQEDRELHSVSIPDTAPATQSAAGSAAARTVKPKPAEKSAAAASTRPAAGDDGKLFHEDLIRVILPLARLAGLAASGLLMLTYLIGVNICLGGRMGGICHSTSAFFWSIALLALLVPWSNLVPATPFQLPDALYGVEQIRAGLAQPVEGALPAVLHYGRFFGCPVLAILAAVTSAVRFSLAYRQVNQAVEPLVLMKVV